MVINNKKRCISCGRQFEKKDLIKVQKIYSCKACYKKAYSIMRRCKEMELELEEQGLLLQDELLGDDWLEEALLDRDDLPEEEDRPDDIECFGTMQENRTMKTPFEIKEHLDRYVIGQDEAKKTLAVAVYNHKKRLRDSLGLIKKSNILLTGPTGCGKTRLAQAVAEVLDVPFAIADASTLTEPGYVGDDVESIISKLVTAANGDYNRAEKGIVFVDEIDKICKRNTRGYDSKGNPGEGVQNALLKMMEGAIVGVPVPTKQKFSFGGAKVLMDTKDILFIFGGAFDGMFDSERGNALGFGRTYEKKEEKVTPEKIREYGFSPEFVGRIPVLVQLNELTREDLVRILKEPADSIIREYEHLFAMDGIELAFEDEALEAIADLAMENKTGARGLRSILEQTMRELMFEIPSKHSPGDVTCLITRDMVLQRRRYAC